MGFWERRQHGHVMDYKRKMQAIAVELQAGRGLSEVQQRRLTQHVYMAYLDPEQQARFMAIERSYFKWLVGAVVGSWVLVCPTLLLVGRPIWDWPRWRRALALVGPSCLASFLLSRRLYWGMIDTLEAQFMPGQRERFVADHLRVRDDVPLPPQLRPK